MKACVTAHTLWKTLLRSARGEDRDYGSPVGPVGCIASTTPSSDLTSGRNRPSDRMSAPCPPQFRFTSGAGRAKRYPDAVHDTSVLGPLGFMVQHDTYRMGQLSLLRKHCGLPAMAYS